MHTDWRRIGRGLAKAISGTIKFFARLLTDVIKDVWKSTRPTVIRWIKWTMLGLLLLYITTQQPDLFASLLKLGVVTVGFIVIFRGVFPKKKKSRK